MNLTDLKNGMVIETRLGDRGLVSNDEILFIDGKCNLRSYNNDLTNYALFVEDSFTIDKVFISKTTGIAHLFDDKYLELIWQRDILKKPEKKYLRLDISGYDNYLQAISGLKNISVTKYIRCLIEKDLKENELVYEKLTALKNI